MTAALMDAPPGLACTGCGRPMRRRGQPAADHPGTVQVGNRGLCSGCTDRARNGRPGPVAPSQRIDGGRDVLIENAEWLTREGNFTDTPQSIAARLGYASLNSLVIALRREGAEDIVQRLYVKAAQP